ncbi:MAG TPA: SLATT domain-containing protein [Ktedonobacterales bacterium]|nr:SLATT domain-containing protein [Ktedonobacterales bacterium]
MPSQLNRFSAPGSNSVTSSTPLSSSLARGFSKQSGRFQTIARVAVGVALVCVTASTVASAFHTVSGSVRFAGFDLNIATSIATGLFLIAIAIRLYRIWRNPERMWFGSRVLAERTRSLVWRYAVAGEPFPLLDGVPAEQTDRAYQHELDGIAKEAESGSVLPLLPRNEPPKVFTEWMLHTRAGSLEDRRKTYAAQRIQGQVDFYNNRAHQNQQAATLTQWLLVLIELTGALLAALNAANIVSLDLVGVVGTVAAGVTAWVQFNQFSALANVYNGMVFRMTAYRERCESNATIWTEERWAEFVSDVESTLATENGAWQRIVQQGLTNSQ